MSRYKEYASKLIAIAIVEGVFYSLMPILSKSIGVHPYELLALITSGVVVAYGVLSFFNALSESKKEKLYLEELRKLTEKATKTADRVSVMEVTREIEEDVKKDEK